MTPLTTIAPMTTSTGTDLANSPIAPSKTSAVVTVSTLRFPLMNDPDPASRGIHRQRAFPAARRPQRSVANTVADRKSRPKSTSRADGRSSAVRFFFLSPGFLADEESGLIAESSLLRQRSGPPRGSRVVAPGMGASLTLSLLLFVAPSPHHGRRMTETTDEISSFPARPGRLFA